MVLITEIKGEIPLLKNLAIPIETLPNLRRVDSGGKLFRSSRQDLLSPTDSEKLSEIGIRSVLDFRSKSEYVKASGEKLYDQNTEVVEVVIPKIKGGQPLPKHTKVSVKPVSVKGKKDNSNGERKRYIIDFFKGNYVKTIFMRIPLYKQLFSLLYLIVDLILRTHYRYFVGYFARQALNPAGLLRSYTDMIELSASQICLALKILSDPANLPALVNCAHGKDRTGIVVALVLSLLGKSDEYIAEEYALSEEGLNPIRSRIYKEIVTDKSMDETFTHARRETMQGLLQYINKNYGSVPDYMESIGFSREEQRRLVEALK